MHTAISNRFAALRIQSIPVWITFPVAVFILTRLAIFGAGLVADALLPTEPGHWIADPANSFLSLWAKWDSQYYFDIASNGYWFNPGRQSNVAFFPLYPMLMRLGAYALGGNVILSGFILSNLACLGAFIFLFSLTELELGDASSARRTVLYLAIFPTAFFLSCVYTESLFLLLAVATMYFARRHIWFAAALTGLLATATRNLGILLWGIVLLELLHSLGFSWRKILERGMWSTLLRGLMHHLAEVLIVCVIPLGLLGYMYFLNQNFERPLAFIETQAAWGRQNVGPHVILAQNLSALFTDPINKSWMMRLLNVSAFLFFLALVAGIWRKLGEGYALYVLIQLLIPATSSTGSIMRYVLPLFPAFIVLGAYGRSGAVDRTLTVGFAILLGVLTAVFVNWIFVA